MAFAVASIIFLVSFHIYGGDFFAAERSEWDPEELTEKPYDIAKARRLLEESNAALG